jgi:hypothetical protein
MSRGLRVLEWSLEISEHLFVTSSQLPKETAYGLRDAYRLRAARTDGESERRQFARTGMVLLEDRYDNPRTVLGREKLGWNHEAAGVILTDGLPGLHLDLLVFFGSVE